MRRIVKIGFAVIGCLLFVTAVVGMCFGLRGWGIYATVALSALFSIGGFCPDKWLFRVPAWIRVCICSVTALILGLYVFLFLYGRADTVTYTEDAVIVLGCGLRGDKPSRSLRLRLDRAIDYHTKNPAALIVVSGGKGTDEAVSEAQAMETYLLEHGVSSEAILKEDASTSTAENFAFSKALLDKHYDGDYRIAFISNSYHIYRAGVIARDAGFADATHAFAVTLWPSVVVSGLRECIAVVAMWLDFAR